MYHSMVYHHPCLTVPAHGKPLGAPKKLEPRRLLFVQSDAHPPPVAGETTSEPRACPAITPGHGLLPPGHRGTSGAGGLVWDWDQSERQTPAPRLRSTSRGQCLQSRAIIRSAIYLSVPPEGLWHSTFGELSHVFKWSIFFIGIFMQFICYFWAFCKSQFFLWILQQCGV